MALALVWAYFLRVCCRIDRRSIHFFHHRQDLVGCWLHLPSGPVYPWNGPQSKGLSRQQGERKGTGSTYRAFSLSGHCNPMPSIQFHCICWMLLDLLLAVTWDLHGPSSRRQSPPMIPDRKRQTRPVRLKLYLLPNYCSLPLKIWFLSSIVDSDPIFSWEPCCRKTRICTHPLRMCNGIGLWVVEAPRRLVVRAHQKNHAMTQA